MTINTSLEERLSAVEAAVVKLQQQVSAPRPMNWLEEVSGAFEDEPAFEAVLAYGQAIRQGDESFLEAKS